MKSIYGIRGSIKPEGYFEEDNPDTLFNGFEISVRNSIIEIGFTNEEEIEEARLSATCFLNAWSFRNNIMLKVDWNSFWKPNSNGGKDTHMALSSSVLLGDHIEANITSMRTIEGTARIVSSSAYDSKEIKNDFELAEKSIQDKTLRDALKYFNDEVLNTYSPLYGIYKAIELIASHLKSKHKNGYDALAEIANQSSKYVDELKETTQLDRHAITQARKHFGYEEAKKRARVLIEAYAKSSMKPINSEKFDPID